MGNEKAVAETNSGPAESLNEEHLLFFKSLSEGERILLALKEDHVSWRSFKETLIEGSKNPLYKLAEGPKRSLAEQINQAGFSIDRIRDYEEMHGISLIEYNSMDSAEKDGVTFVKSKIKAARHARPFFPVRKNSFADVAEALTGAGGRGLLKYFDSLDLEWLGVVNQIKARPTLLTGLKGYLAAGSADERTRRCHTHYTYFLGFFAPNLVQFEISYGRGNELLFARFDQKGPHYLKTIDFDHHPEKLNKRNLRDVGGFLERVIEASERLSR